jgi:hypothetical protein
VAAPTGLLFQASQHAEPRPAAKNSPCRAKHDRLLLAGRNRPSLPSPRMSHKCRYCCKKIFRIRASNIDSRSSPDAQCRFKNWFAVIRLLRPSCPPPTFATISANCGHRGLANEPLTCHRKVVLHWGEMGTRWGISRTVAQIHALLYSRSAR